MLWTLGNGRPRLRQCHRLAQQDYAYPLFVEQLDRAWRTARVIQSATLKRLALPRYAGNNENYFGVPQALRGHPRL